MALPFLFWREGSSHLHGKDTMVYKKEIEVDGLKIEMALWDAQGDEHDERLRPLSYPQSDVILICFAIDCPTSFSNVTEKVKASRISSCVVTDGRAL